MNDSIFDKALDSMIAEAAKRADKELGEQAGCTDESIEFSGKHEKKMNRLFAKVRRRQKLVKFSKYLRRAACVLIAVCVAGGVSLFSVKAWRNRVLNFVFDSKATHTDFEIIDSTQTFKNDFITVGYLPKGFELEKDFSNEMSALIRFENGKDDIKIGKYSLSASITIDTENSNVEEIKIHSYPGKYIDNPRFNSVMWYTDEWIYQVISTLDRAEVVRIAESIY